LDEQAPWTNDDGSDSCVELMVKLWDFVQ
jgi:hypothetical protein